MYCSSSGRLSREECEDAVCILIACTFKILHYTPLACLWNCAIEITNLARLSAHSNGRILHRWALCFDCAVNLSLLLSPKTNGNLSRCSLMWDCLDGPFLFFPRLSRSPPFALFSMRLNEDRLYEQTKKTRTCSWCWHCCQCGAVRLFSRRVWSL